MKEKCIKMKKKIKINQQVKERSRLFVEIAAHFK